MGNSTAYGDGALQRVVILGTSGSGKSTLARRIADWSGADHIELDGLYHGPGWTPMPVERFQKTVAELTAGPKWIVDGNYIDKLADVLWHRADTIIWLDVPLPVILARLIRRSVSRIILRTELWHGNQENWRNLFGRNSVVRWAIVSHRRHRSELPLRLSPPCLTGVSVVRLRSSAEVNRWLTGCIQRLRS